MDVKKRRKQDYLDSKKRIKQRIIQYCHNKKELGKNITEVVGLLVVIST